MCIRDRPYIILFFEVLDKGVLLLPPLTRSPSLKEGGFGIPENFSSSPEAPSLRQTPPAGGGGTKCQKGNSWHRAAMTEGVWFSKKPQYFLKKGLHFARQSATIVKLIILIPYFTVGGAITMAKCECCGKGVTFGIKVSHSHRRSNRTWKPNVRRVKAVVEGSPKYVYACSRCLRAGKVTRAV